MTKTISLSDEAYDALAGAKRPGESFSEVARRLARLAALDDVFAPDLRLPGDGADWKKRVRDARDADARRPADLG
ncbi:MAG TPA: antitoxin VapB family protein [Candidatus Thermoplasmatota archaeon]|nr:antitoxin VapB family protein [Candidatus Thermoplasmatota archaeon]